MKKTLAGLGVLALVSLGVTGASIPANAFEVQPVAEIVAESDAVIASPDAILTQSEPVVITSPAPEPVALAEVLPEPVAAPVALVAPAVAPVPLALVAEAPVASEPVAVAVAPVEPVAVVAAPVVDLAALALDEARTLNLKGFISTVDASAEQRPGYVYTPSSVDPSKVHVSVE